jgi:PPIC-type PPIASE domain
MNRLFAVLLFSTLAFAQAAKPAPPTAMPSAQPAAQSAPAAKAGEVPASAPVLTLEGVCNGKVAAAPAPACKTVITRAEFEKLVDALDPNMASARRRQLAEVYARMLVMSDAAAQRGLENSPDTREVLHFMRLQTLTQLLLRQMQKEAANVPLTETEKYYNAHPRKFEQAKLLRIFLPKTPPSGSKPPDEKTLEAEAGKMRAAAVAGGDLEKLQKQAYDDLGIKTPPPPVSAGTQRRESVPAAQQKIFDLQPGQVSPVINEPGGLYIFKLESKKKLTLPEVTPEINRTLEAERMKEALDKITGNVKPVLNEQYFGAEAPSAPGLMPPGARPAPRPVHPLPGPPSNAPPPKPPKK